MKIREITNYIEEIAPLSYQEKYDNCGLLVGRKDDHIDAILVTLDCTEAVIDEAIETGCNLIIAHHPIIFTGIKKLNGSNYIERTIIKAIRNNIAIYSLHTTLDKIFNGVSYKIADKLGLVNCKILATKNQDINLNLGYGIIGDLVESVSSKIFLKKLKTIMQTDCIRYTPLVKNIVKKIAVCGGSGSFLLNHVRNSDVDLFISADFKYHEFFDADNQFIIADIGHYESEQFTKDLIFDLLTKKFTKFAVQLSQVNTNPIKYL